MELPTDNTFCIDSVAKLLYTIFNVQLDCEYCDNLNKCYKLFESNDLEYDIDLSNHLIY